MLCDGNMFHTIHVVDGLGKNRAAKFTIPQYECRENLRRTSIYNESQILSKRTSIESSEPFIGSNDKKQTMVMVTGAGLLEPQYRD
ncbi:hypothetical protein IGI04_010231 [Brassica rapa subsp. trilocularis]|uniref:Uncharacterized protein n=1 Tax=Brassica rapa subsp. trilocularis TaxID=1813537 RepID=A0ABQ7MZK9_BRACM|nr:hypothetical protein IGI04_010231 [Brassica rapa subsp. trilocularis]